MSIQITRVFDFVDGKPHVGDPKRDILFEAFNQHGGQALGYLALRPMLYAHSFDILPDCPLPPRLVGDALFRFAEGFATHARDASPAGATIPFGTLFHVHRDNATMRRFIESKGAYAELDSLLYRYDL